MNLLDDFNRIMTEHTEIALASCVENVPNVRIMNFFYDQNSKGILYFSTFKDNPKTAEFAANKNVSFTTVPQKNNEHVRVYKAEVKKSEKTIFDLREGFTKKIPDYEDTIDQAGTELDLYEVHFNKASVTLDMARFGDVTL